MPPRRVLLAYLNTGGGHRSAALAVAEALEERHGENVQINLVDVTAEHFPWPLSKLSVIYDWLVRLNGLPWAIIYHLTNGPRRVAMLRHGWWILTKRPILDLLGDCPGDVILCCHPLLRAPLSQALRAEGRKTPLITLVTDLASGHATWFHPQEGSCIVATEQARAEALACGYPAKSVEMTGLPVRPCFARAAERDRAATREDLGLGVDRPVVLLLSGADGMGPFYSLVRLIMAETEDVQVVAITGRNERLRAKLTARAWQQRLWVKGFVENIQDWMQAADLLVTKAGPATITEAFVVGTPMILSGAIPGQEPPNVTYALETGAAIWAPQPAQAAEAVKELLSAESKKLQQMTENARGAACPEAAWRVADIVWSAADRSTRRSGQVPIWPDR